MIFRKTKPKKKKRMDYRLYTSDWPRIFLVSELGPPIYHYTVAAWRLLWNGGRQRAIFRCRFGMHDFLENFPEGCTLEIVAGICDDPSVYDPDHVIIRLENCRSNRRWIPNMMALSSDERSVINYWLEVDCEIEIVQEGIKNYEATVIE